MDNLYTGNRLESLCQTLADNIRNKKGDLFGKEIIITPSAGMKSWLKTELAKRNGVFANFEFTNQDGLFSGLYRLLFKEQLKNNIDNVKYKLFDCLDNDSFKSSFHDVAKYYSENDLRRIQLSARIADLFDQYQLYRNEMIEAWERDELATDNPAEKWQQWLWKELRIESRARIKQRIIDQMEDQKELIRKTYPEISLFGISVYTRFHLDFFRILAKYTNVNFYLCLPARETSFKNELLVSFGSKAGELMSQFDIEKFILEGYNGDTLLARIQNQIVNNSTDLEFREDESVQISSCFTQVREVECLYNYLLSLFEADPALKPGDILVMATDINKYAPLIKAVFNNAPVTIPFQVSGAVSTSEDSIAAALEQIMRFSEDDLTSEKVISLLEQKRIKQRFAIGDCDYIRTVVRKANIRFGRENSVEDDSHFVSWKYGLEKILLGYAMLTDKEYLVHENVTLFPFRDTEASDSYDLLRLKAFVGKLESIIDEQDKLRTLSKWKEFLIEDVIEKMVYCDDFDKDDRTELSSIKRVLSFIDNLEFDKKVPFAMFLDELNSKLFKEPMDSKLNTGRVTVSSPIPVRGIPFKVICFIGLNNDIFPGKDQFMGFDLLGEKYLAGDRNKKETDKYLFLDTLLAAREKLYLSYIGQNVKDNSTIPPSIVADTFLDYLGSDSILVRHPLHGFSSAYHNNADKRLFTYFYGEQATEFCERETDPKKIEEIRAASFVKFFENPVDWYFDNILGIKYENTNDTLPETELFELDSIQEWFVKQSLIKTQNDQKDSFIRKGIKEGQLPLKNLGKVTVDDLHFEISELKSKFHELIAGREEQKALIDIKVGETRIAGTIDGIYGSQYIAYAFSDRLKYKARVWVNALLLFAEGKISEASFSWLKKDLPNPPSLFSETIAFIEPAEAMDKISELMTYFSKGKLAPLKFTPDAARKVLKMEKVENIFSEEAEGNSFASIPVNQCMKRLYEEDYFVEFDIENFKKDDFDEAVYDEERFTEIKTIAGLLNLNIK